MKVLYVTTVGTTMRFFKELIKELVKEGNTVDIACNEKNYEVDDDYRDLGCTVFQVDWTRSPLSPSNIGAIKALKKIVADNRYDVVHCHTPVAGFCARMACRSLRKDGVKVFYTSHGFHFYKGAPLKNWLIYYPIEKLCAHFTDVLITINSEDYHLAKLKMKSKQVEYVPGVGIDVEKFKNTAVDRAAKRKELGLSADDFVLLSVGELNKNKNHQIIIHALAKMQNPTIHYVIAGKGELLGFLNDLSNKLGVADRVHLIGFRNDVNELYKIADVDVFPSIREGLGLAALEGMAAGLPLICSDNRGTRSYAANGVNAFVCSGIEDYIEAIKQLQNPDKRAALGGPAKETAEKFDQSAINEKMRRIYFGEAYG